MQTENRFFDDFAKLINGAAGTLAGVGREAEAAARERAKEWIGGLDFVSRDEFEAVKEMAARAREEGEEMRARLEGMENSTAQTALHKEAEEHIAFDLISEERRGGTAGVRKG